MTTTQSRTPPRDELPATELRGAAFFDLDRTLVRVNTGPRYVAWRVGQGQLRWSDLVRVSWWAWQYKFGVLDAETVSARAARSVKNTHEPSFARECSRWVDREILRHITDEARRALDRERAKGRIPVVLTSSSPYVAVPVAAHLGIEHVLSSELEIREDLFTGRLAQPLCYGPEKVVRAERWASEHGVSLSVSSFYTDSLSDLPMLDAVREPRVVNPDPRLSVLARRRGWTTEAWL